MSQSHIDFFYLKFMNYNNRTVGISSIDYSVNIKKTHNEL